MARCLNCIHFDVCDTDRHGKEHLYGDCSDFLNDNDVAPMCEWMSVDERLPETLTTVLVYDTHTQSIRFGQYRVTDELWHNGRITHWMPLPEAPKMKGGAE